MFATSTAVLDRLPATPRGARRRTHPARPPGNLAGGGPTPATLKGRKMTNAIRVTPEPVDLFADAALFYFPAAEADYPTRAMCKALAVALFQEDGEFDDLVDEETEEGLAAELRTAFPALIPEDLFLWVVMALMVWSKDQPGAQPPDDIEPWLEGQADRMDWLWIARVLKAELTKHRHRKDERTFELLYGKPFEHLEAKMGLRILRPEESAS